MAWRILLAVALMVGFYLFAVAIAFVLLWIPYAEWKYVGSVHTVPAGLQPPRNPRRL